MTIQFNGRPVELEAALSVEALLERMEMSGRRLAVERNRELVPRRLWSQVGIEDGDRVEVVQFVGGG